ncbi:MAG: tetratricopeptide repeat protein [Pseudomonadota bacterium]
MGKKFGLVLALAFGLQAPAAMAVGPSQEAMKAQYAQIPLCKAKMISPPGSPDVGYWSNALGPDWLHVHHYCIGLAFLNLHYGVKDKFERGWYLGEAVGSFDYVIRAASPGYVLLPENHFKKGQALLFLRKEAEAAAEFRQAIQLRPDYADPYAALADFMVSKGNKQEAMKLVEEGLRQAPKSRGLARRYQELGGKLPLPGMSPPAAEAPQPEVTPSMPVEPVGKKDAAPSAEPQVSVDSQTTPSEPSPAKIGSPPNPWCRFCPDADRPPAQQK